MAETQAPFLIFYVFFIHSHRRPAVKTSQPTLFLRNNKMFFGVLKTDLPDFLVIFKGEK